MTIVPHSTLFDSCTLTRSFALLHPVNLLTYPRLIVYIPLSSVERSSIHITQYFFIAIKDYNSTAHAAGDFKQAH